VFRPQVRRTNLSSAIEIFELIFHGAVRTIRKSSGNAVLGLVMNIIQSLVMILIFYFMFNLFGMRGAAIRGDFMLYVMSGVFMFTTHIKAIGAVAGADGPTSPMMLHSPMNSIISIGAAAMSALYMQVLSAGVILFVYHAVISPITIDDPTGVLGMMMLSWGSGVAIGMIIMGAMPWQPELFGIVKSVYMRMNMIASGKMFVANAAPPNIRNLFDWNPLFHTIDQTRGYAFLNYEPRYTSVEYPLLITVICIIIGLVIERFTRKYVSLSWGSRR
jgi:ABC-type polysaccharide/polyol phosphate export permease